MRTIVLLPLALLTFGCAHSREGDVARSRSRGLVQTMAATVPGPAVPHAPAILPAAPAAELRKPGDFVVFRFSGSFRKEPLLLTQRVVAVEGTLATIDMTLASENEKTAGVREHLRVVFDRTPGATREVSKVTRVDGDREDAGTLEDYEKLMAKTIVVPDRNDDVIGSEVVSTNVGGAAMDVKKTSYRVAFGNKSAVMSTMTNDGFAWGDVGGEIKADNGKVIYRAEVVQIGKAGAAATAKNDAR